MRKHIIFDLDGTLVDSADAILEGFRTVLAETGQTARVPIDSSLIGPPLQVTMARLTGLDDPVALDAIVKRFIDWYDTDGFLGTRVYPGIPECLQALHAAGAVLSIVTNKRLRPTRAILAWLGWVAWFSRVDTQDARPDAPLGTKTEVLARLLSEQQANPSDAIYVGDRRDDVLAAAANGLDCLLVAWGYGSPAEYPAGSRVVATPSELQIWLEAT